MTTHSPLRCAFSGMAANDGYITLLNSGNYPSFSSWGNETWIWNWATNGNEDWTNLSTSFISTTAPLGPSVPTAKVQLSGRNFPVVAYDGYNTMVYGGQGSSSLAGVFQDTWTFAITTQTWTLQSPTTVPYGRTKAAGAYLPTIPGVVMFGGSTVYNILEETWLWNGNTQAWSQLVFANGVGPAARIGHVMAANTTTVVLFGGNGTSNNLFNDTWTFNGTTWTQVTPAGGVQPSVRTNACMSYDSHNGVFVLFGGENDSTYLNDTWTFTVGTSTWAQVTVANGAGPAARIGAQMAFDTTNNLTIMFGGISAGTNYPSNNTWAFNGGTNLWSLLG